MVISPRHVQVLYRPGEEAVARAFYGAKLGSRRIERRASLPDRDGIWHAAGDGRAQIPVQDDLALGGGRHPGWRRCHVSAPFSNEIKLDELG